MVWANVIHIIRTIVVTTKPVHKYNQSGEYRVPKSVTVESSPPSVPRPLLLPPHLHRIWLHPLVGRPLPSSPHSLSYPLPLPLGPVLVGQVVWAEEPPTPVCVFRRGGSRRSLLVWMEPHPLKRTILTQTECTLIFYEGHSIVQLCYIFPVIRGAPIPSLPIQSFGPFNFLTCG